MNLHRKTTKSVFKHNNNNPILLQNIIAKLLLYDTVNTHSIWYAAAATHMLTFLLLVLLAARTGGEGWNEFGLEWKFSSLSSVFQARRVIILFVFVLRVRVFILWSNSIHRICIICYEYIVSSIYMCCIHYHLLLSGCQVRKKWKCHLENFESFNSTKFLYRWTHLWVDTCQKHKKSTLQYSQGSLLLKPINTY